MVTKRQILLCFFWLVVFANLASAQSTRPNIIWIVVEDASPHIGSYGQKLIKTPHLDRLAEQGVQFDRAFVTCPVCSPCRSAMVTGMYQTTLGSHNHRSQGSKGKARGTEAFFDSYRLPIPSIPRLFKNAGYYSCNSATGLANSKFGKTDYNFVWDKSDYDGADWAGRKPGQPFFAQIQLRGGKNRSVKKHSTDPAAVVLPPYYPDHPVLRNDWASYLNSWVQTDIETGAILQRLEDEKIADSTVVFFWTDHGVSHVRGKQFLYEEGIRVPLIVRNPDAKDTNSVRTDLVSHIDIAASSLALAGIEIPKHVQGVDVFANDYRPREMIISARDRCDETVEIQRSVRTAKYKYIRNFLPHLPHLQPNQYKDGKTIVKTMRSLHLQGKLTELQSRVFNPTRPREELYDLENDPHETINLAGDSKHAETVDGLRTALYEWMVESRDVGLIPEPILEELGAKFGSKYRVLQREENRTLIRDLLRVIDATESQVLVDGLKSEQDSIRYWAATSLGVRGDAASVDDLAPMLRDSSSGVRVAASLAMFRLGKAGAAKALANEIANDNLLTGLYAIRALEMTGDNALPHSTAILAACNSPYEFTRRIARRLSDTLDLH
ncbi:MAG TPA: sulfatase [Planctomycetaceae bacterium]|nr:sulfatase [Planctomycetaceae bacterium]